MTIIIRNKYEITKATSVLLLVSLRSQQQYVCVCVCVFVVISFILDVRLADAPAGFTQEEGHTGFCIHLPSAVLALIFLARRIQPSLSLVDREVEFCSPTNELSSTRWA